MVLCLWVVLLVQLHEGAPGFPGPFSVMPVAWNLTSPFYHPCMCIFASLLRVGACAVQTFAPQNDPSNDATGSGMFGEEKDDPGMAQSPAITADAAATSIPTIALV